MVDVERTSTLPSPSALPASQDPPPLTPPQGGSLEESVDLLHRAWVAQERLRQDVRTRIEFADGDQIRRTRGMPDETSEHRAKKPRFAPNLLGLSLDMLSYIYADDPVRTADNTELWEDSLWDWREGLSAILADADPLLRLGGTSLAYAHPAFGGGPQELEAAYRGEKSKAEAVDVFIATRDKFVLSEDAADPRYIGACAIHIRTEVEQPTDGTDTRSDSARTTHYHEYWDRENFAVLRNWEIIQSTKHGLDDIPCRTLKNTLSPTSLYGRSLGGRDLLDNFIAINAMIVELLHVGRLQRGQPVAIGEIQENSTLGPDSIIRITEALGAAAGFRFESNNADINGMLATLEAQINLLARTYHLPMRAVAFANVTASGLSIQNDRIELQEDRRKRTRLAREWERSIAEVADIQGNKWGIPLDSSTVRVAFPVGAPALTHAEVVAQSAFELEHGLATPREVKRNLHPHLSESEIDELMTASEEYNRKLVENRTRIAGHASDNPTVLDETDNLQSAQSQGDSNGDE